MKAKGITPRRSGIDHQSYLRSYLDGEEISVDQTRFQSINHQLYTSKSNKKALSAHDNKRAWISQNESRAYGHYSLNYENSDDDERLF